MCMTINKPLKKVKVRKTLFPHTYYKVLFKSWSEYFQDWQYLTPYFNMDVVMDREYRIPEDEEWEFSTVYPTAPSSYVDGGGFHLFRTIKGAMHEFLSHGWTAYTSYIIVKAVVPPGTEYVKGYYCGEKSIVVRRVKYKKPKKVIYVSYDD